jgi:hypothetical protein
MLLGTVHSVDVLDSKPVSGDSGKLKPYQRYPNTILPVEERANDAYASE